MPEGRMLRITLPCLPPAEYSANYSRGQHWAKKQSITQGAHDDIIALVLEQGWQGQPLEKATVSITFHLPDRRKRDPGGLQERMKPWFDGLVKAGVLQDDSLDVIGWPSYAHVYSKGNPQTCITIASAP